MITSKDNSKIKLARALQADSKTRWAEGAFVVEGIRLVEEALISKWEITWAVYTDELGERGRVLIQDMIDRGISVEQVTSRIMHSASDTQTPQGVLAVVQNRSTPLPSKLDFVLIVDELRDPGNLGTMLRTASAAGVGAVLLGRSIHFRQKCSVLQWARISACQLIPWHGIKSAWKSQNMAWQLIWQRQMQGSRTLSSIFTAQPR
jgi:tRNA G18 (ribose-2'-O)-methylase SpoU